jgi:hypothetical protein
MPLQALRPKLLGALPSVLALMLCLGLDGAGALGLGRPQVQSLLGRPLDVAIPLTLADGEQLGDACLRADVTAGDVRVPAGLLQLRVEGDPGQQRVRLKSLAVIEEPVLRITVALGCPVRLTREFNAIVDPAPSAPPTAAASPIVMPAATPAVELAPVRESTAGAAPKPADAVAATAPAAWPREHRPRARVVAKARAAVPRLVLEAPEVLVSAAPRPAASAPEMELTPELEATLAQLEQTVAQLRAELEARQAEQAAAAASATSAASAVAASAPPVAAAPAAVRSVRVPPYRDPMTWLMTLGLSLLSGAGAFYWSRWRDVRTRRERAYWRAVHAAGTADAAPAPTPAPAPANGATGMAPPVQTNAALLPDEGQHTETRPQPRPMPWPPLAAASAEPAPLSPAGMDTIAMPVPGAAQSLSAADELLDLQQQLDFLQLLGQHEAASDLLTARVTRGAAGAMPYLMLMEVCQQRGEPALFAELAQQFERRFGRLAPQWPQSLARGRTLDTCPSVIAHLQVVWADPEVAVQMLQGLIANGAGPGAPSFDLPAYRDLLTLYSVARDLYEAGLRGDGVDLMLPLDSQL